MNSIVNCPGCGFSGRLPEGLASLKTIVCPQCRTSVAVDQLQRLAAPEQDASFPIWVDSMPVRPNPRPLVVPAAPPPPPQEPKTEGYADDYMKEEAQRFAQYVAARLDELHKRRLELAEAENRFESVAMEKKQDLHRQHGSIAAEAERIQKLQAALQAKEATLTAREVAVAEREAELAVREGRVARAEARATDADRRTAELRAAIDALETRRSAVAEERAALDRRAESLDRAELALHRRTAELDELDERLRLEQEEFERERDQFLSLRHGS